MSERFPPEPSPYSVSRGGFDVMQVCRNGHQITAALRQMPELGRKFCPECGGATLAECDTCKHPIPGLDWSVVSAQDEPTPKYCVNCGEPDPWTVMRLAALDEMIGELERLDEQERATLAGAIRDLTADTARTELGITRFRRLAAKAGVAAGTGLYKLAVDVGTEAVKKALLGP